VTGIAQSQANAAGRRAGGAVIDGPAELQQRLDVLKRIQRFPRAAAVPRAALELRLLQERAVRQQDPEQVERGIGRLHGATKAFPPQPRQ